MSARTFVPKILVSLLAALAIAPAPAATFTETLTGNLSTVGTQSFTFGGNEYERYTLGLDGMTPIIVGVGDTITFDVMLSRPFTLEGSSLPGAYNEYQLFSGGASFPAVSTGVEGTFTLLNSSVTTGVLNTSSSTNGSLALYAVDTATTRTFNELQMTMVVENLSGVSRVNLSSAALVLGEVTPVPEPGSGALALAGLISLAMVVRRRRG